MNQAFLKKQWFWLTIVHGHVLTEFEVRDLKPGAHFAECDKIFSEDQPAHKIRKNCPDMVVVPSGDFMMGSSETEIAALTKEFPNVKYPNRKDWWTGESPQHRVRIAKPFAVSKFAVTFDQWDACVDGGGCDGYKPFANFGRGTRPVINVRWEDAQQYVAWLNNMMGGTSSYRLLSEAEFEYAARAKTTTRYPWGDKVEEGNASCSGCGSQWDYKGTAPAGSFKPNAFGLYDMHGNAWQWVDDCFHYGFTGAPENGSVWQEPCEKFDVENKSVRVARGGSWNFRPEYARSATRFWDPSINRSYTFGIRVARTLAP
jgi:formylglycine-generating enzyme required for sulfatase activity